MKLQAHWQSADDTDLIDMLRDPDASGSLVYISAAMEISQDERPICVYDDKDYNILEWALTNGYHETFDLLLAELVDHAKNNPNDIPLIVAMIEETQRMVTRGDANLIFQECDLDHALRTITTLPRPRIEKTFRPDDG